MNTEKIEVVGAAALAAKKMNASEKKVYAALAKVEDPELGLPITELGLVYAVEVDEKEEKATITMTLTTMGCPLFDVIEEEIKDKMKGVKEVGKVRLELVFDPPWNPDMMTDDAKAKLGFL